MSEKILTVKDLVFSYGDLSILQGVSFSLFKGEILSLLGASGAGKTTLFRLIAGLEEPSQGSLEAHGFIGSPKEAQAITYLTQENLLLPWRTVLDNVLLTAELGLHQENAEQAKEEALRLLSEVGLAKWVDNYPDQLSGGMRKRVALARALMSHRPILLLDEPFQGLDYETEEQIADLLKRIGELHGLSILLITHNRQRAHSVSDRVLCLQQGTVTEESCLC